MKAAPTRIGTVVCDSGDRLEVAYETFGSPSDPTLLAIGGLTAQLIEFPDDFCGAVADAGFHLVRFDNRDVGLSTKLDWLPTPDLEQILDLMSGHGEPPYTLEDMADDAVALMDALGLRQAHLMGSSMGGMIAQLVALRHRDRALSLTCVSSSSGDPRSGFPEERGVRDFLDQPATPAGRIARTVEAWRWMNGNRFPFEEAESWELARRLEQRGHYPPGRARQLAAVAAAPDRTTSLAALGGMPTSVVHGSADPLIAPVAAEILAGAIPGARLRLLEGVGHGVPRPLWPVLIDEIAQNVSLGEEPRGRPVTGPYRS